jgi:hypothetical protein
MNKLLSQNKMKHVEWRIQQVNQNQIACYVGGGITV